MAVEDDSVKVIAIKLPSELQDRILAFSFLHAISEFYPKADIHLITPKKDVEVLNLLPFRAFYHLFNEDEIRTIFDVHPYTANANIYNVDIFISLTNSFVDACLGIGLRAKRRIGYSDNWKTLVLNESKPRPVGHHIVEDFMGLLEMATGVPENKRLRVLCRNLPRMIEDTTPYIAINLSPLREATIEEEWFELLSLFEGQKIVLFASEEQVKVQMLMENFINRLPKKNTYVNFSYHDHIELARMLAYSNGVITYSGACGALAAYVGTKTLILYENEDPQRTGPFYFLTDISIMSSNNPTLVNSPESTGALKKRAAFKMEEVVAKAYEFFRLG